MRCQTLALRKTEVLSFNASNILTEGMGTMKCKARQFSDEMYCQPCGLRWDMNDPCPPACKPKVDARFEEPAPTNITEIRERYERENGLSDATP